MSRGLRSAIAWLGLLGLAGCGSEPLAMQLAVSVLYPPGGKGDLGMADAIEDGVIAARIGLDFSVEELQPKDLAEAESMLDAALELPLDRHMVIAGSDIYAARLNERDCQLRGKAVLQLERSVATCGGLRSVELDVFGPAYLAGVAAAALSSTTARKAALVVTGLQTSPAEGDLIEGFTRGVQDSGGGVVLEVVATSGRAQARPQGDPLLGGVDTVLVVAGPANAEVLEQLQDYLDAHPDSSLRLIAVEQDLSVIDGEAVLASVLQRWDWVVRDALRAVNHDTLPSGNATLGFRDGYTELLLNPLYEGERVDGESLGCDSCETVRDAVEAAEDAAAAAALERL